MDMQRDLGSMKATEDATRKNVVAIRDYTKETRLMAREAIERVDYLVREVETLRRLLDTQRVQIAALRAQVLGGGRTVPDGSDG